MTNNTEQEPVCYVVQDELGLWWASDKQGKYTDSIPVYAAPVRTKDLTDDEISRLWYDSSYGDSGIDFARAVIAADREKNR